MLLLESLKYEINNHKIISFDIFDTLLLRPYVKPTDVFLHIETLENKPNFFEIRQEAETKARKTHKNQEDITLDDIYNEIDDEYKYIKQIEIDLETQILQQNKEIFEVFEYAKQQGKKVIVISDMYLNKNILENILNLKGYKDYCKLYLSNEIKKTKATGNLYKYVIEDLGVEGKDIFHIGDNYQSDIEKAKENGIETYYYEKVGEKFLNKIGNEKFKILLKQNPNNLDISIIIGMIILNWHNKIDKNILNYWEDFGYNIGGPVCYGFAKFAMEEAKKQNISDLFFIARDGYTLNKVYDIIKGDCNIKNHYVYAPRILKILCLLEYGDLEMQLNSLFEKFANISEDFKKTLPQKFNSFDEKKEFFEKNKQILLETAEKNKEKYRQYIKSLNLKGNKIALLDSVAQGFSAQRLLIEILKDNDICGLYFRVISEYGKQHNYNYTTYEQDIKHSLNSWNIMEFIMTAPELPISNMIGKDIEYQKNPSIYELTRKETYKIISEKEEEFSKNLINVFGDTKVEFKAQNIINFINCFCGNLNKLDEMYFSNIYHACDSNHTKYESLLQEFKNTNLSYSINIQNNYCKTIRCLGIDLMEIKSNFNKTTFKLFNCIIILNIKQKENKLIYKLFNILPIIEIKYKHNKKQIKLFGFIHLLTIKSK